MHVDLILNGMGLESTPWRFFLHCAKTFGTKVQTFQLLILFYGSFFAVAFVNILSTVLPLATLLLNKFNLKNVVKCFYFYLYGRTDMKYEISVSELTPPPNFSLIPLKIKKLDFDPKIKEMTITVIW